MVIHTGGCHCGAVEYEVEAPAAITAELCNCSICSMTSYLHLIVPVSRFRLTRGEEMLETYSFNTGVAQHRFCRSCGVKSFYVPRSNPDGISVNVRCLRPETIDSVTVRSFDGRNWELHADELAHLSVDTPKQPGLIAETRRLKIRELTVDDADFILGLVNEPSFLENIGDKGVRDLDDARRFILEGPWAAGQPPGHGQFAVEVKTSGLRAGVCGILYRERLDLTDIGCAFLPQFWRRGFATEAATAVMSYARATLGVDAIVALTAEHNLASIKLLEKMGFRLERTVKMTEDDPGTLVYG
jgi:RimJ/RimL family protein N-acetyltransferase